MGCIQPLDHSNCVQSALIQCTRVGLSNKQPTTWTVPHWDPISSGSASVEKQDGQQMSDHVGVSIKFC